MPSLSSPAARARKKRFLQIVAGSVTLALLALLAIKPQVGLSLLCVIGAATLGRRRLSLPAVLVTCAGLVLVLILGLLYGGGGATASPPAVEHLPPPDHRRGRRRHIPKWISPLRLLSGYCILVAVVIVGPARIARVLGRWLKSAGGLLPSFGLVDDEGYARQREETTKRELEKLREHLRRHGAPPGASAHARSRLGTFVEGMMGITRSEALQWIVSSLYAEEGDTVEDCGFKIGDDGRRIDDDDEGGGSDDDLDGDGDGGGGSGWPAAAGGQGDGPDGGAGGGDDEDWEEEGLSWGNLKYLRRRFLSRSWGGLDE